MKALKHTYYISLLLIVIGCSHAIAQTQVSDFLNYGLSNARALSEPFLEPYANMIDASMMSGWNRSPRVLRPSRFSVHYFHNQSFLGSSQFIDVAKMITNQQLSGVSLQDPDVFRSPTAVYKSPEILERPTLIYNETPITMPNGEDMEHLSMPVIAATMGTPFSTDVSIRVTLPLDYTYLGKSFMWGVGIKHSLIPYFRFMQKHPFLETAIMASYSQLDASDDLSYQGQTSQSLDITGKIISGRLLFGAHFNVVDLFGSVGYSNRTSNIGLKGEFSNIPGQTESISNPLSFDYDFSAIEYEAGVQVRIYFINLQASYTYSKRSMISLGAGVTIP